MNTVIEPPMTTELHSLLDRVGQEALLELLEAYAVHAGMELPKHSPDSQLIGVVGFTARKLRGNLALVMSPLLVEATHGTCEILDWTGELTNQYVGRIKNKLLPYGISLEIATPVVVTGLSIKLQERRGTETRRIDCNTESGPVHALINIRVAQGFELQSPAELGPAASEGEMLLW